MKRLLSLLLPTALALASVRAGAQAPADSGAVLTPGDLLHIEVWRQPTLSGDFPIADDGSIIHPLYREVRVAGLPMATVEARIRQFLTRYEASPSLVIVPRHTVVVGGEVRTPNILNVPFGTTIVKALALAGGFTERADIRRVRLVRAGATQTLDLSDPASSTARLSLLSGDQLLVGRANSFFRDTLAPASSVLAAVGGLIGIIVTLTR